jgi:ADP-heptose:LPS heptosyltransferase
VACLVIKNDGIGDLVLSSGLIADLAKRFDGVDLVTCEQNRELAAHIPGVRRCLEVSRDWIQFHPWPARLGLRWVRSTPSDRAVFRWLAENSYETAICLRRFIRQSSLVLMSKVRATHRHCAWMYPTNASEAMALDLSDGWQRYAPTGGSRSELAYYREFLSSSLGIESRSPPILTCAGSSVGAFVPGRIGLCLSGNSTNWPTANWLTLADSLHRQGRQLVLFGGADAKPLAADIARACPGADDLTDQLGFAKSVPHLQTLELMIGNDTGFTHFASLAARKLIIILGGGTFGRFFPWPESDRQFVVFHGLDCYDCGWQCKFPSRECMDLVSPSAVFDYAQAVLAGTAPQILNLNPRTVTCQLGWRFLKNSGEVAELTGCGPVT